MDVWVGDATVGVWGGGVDVEMETMGFGVPPGDIRIKKGRSITK
jgi:hypothetical protein